MSDSLDLLKNEYLRLANILGVSGTLPVTINEWGDGAHVEWHQDGYHFVTYVERRNGEFSRRVTTDMELILGWLFAPLVFNLACDYAAKNVIDGQDWRRQLFAKELELLTQLNPKWAEERRQEIDETLASSPYVDKKQRSSKTERWTYRVIFLIAIIGALILYR